MHRLPLSFVFFLLTAIVMLLQVFPYTGILLMMIGAALWSILLINLGMLGTAVEAAAGRVSRWWLIIPVAWFGAYTVAVVRDTMTMQVLRAQIAADNARVHIPFDTERQSLVLSNINEDLTGLNSDLILNDYAVPVIYKHFDSTAPGEKAYFSKRLARQADCKNAHELPGAPGAGVSISSPVDDKRDRYSRPADRDFCILGQPEAPSLPQIRVRSIEREMQVNGMPTVQAAMTIETPGKTYRVRGGRAAPLRWFPMLAMGCFLDSGKPSWDCQWGFLRGHNTLLTRTDKRAGTDAAALARALRLRRVPPSQRRGAPSTLVMASARRAIDKALAADFTDLDRVAADPDAKVGGNAFRVLAMRPDALSARADQLMRALEKAVRAPEIDGGRARQNGQSLAVLVAGVPEPYFIAYGARVLALYGAIDDDHWLWGIDQLFRRIGDLGKAAIPVAIRPREIRTGALGNGDAVIEALCRIGLPARAQATPMLLQAWAETRPSDHRQQLALFVAMRRVGIGIPSLIGDKRGEMAEILKDWNDISPRSPRSVCAIVQEDQTRRAEKRGKQP